MDDNENAALAAKLTSLDITLEGHRRPVLLGALIDAGLQSLRPGAKNAKAVITAILDAAMHGVRHQHDVEVAALRRKVEELERRLASGASAFTVADITQMRTYHEYGMSAADLAELYRVDIATINTALGRRGTKKKSVRKQRRLSI
jgi:hypothetical protein